MKNLFCYINYNNDNKRKIHVLFSVRRKRHCCYPKEASLLGPINKEA